MAHEQDLTDDALLLRYMSFAKFVAMLSSRSLHLCRLDALGDKVRAYTLALRSSTYVSCWSQGPESEAMWRLYSDGHEGVAMVTTLDKLRKSLARMQTPLPCEEPPASESNVHIPALAQRVAPSELGGDPVY
jgi:hypothetical protein